MNQKKTTSTPAINLRNMSPDLVDRVMSDKLINKCNSYADLFEKALDALERENIAKIEAHRFYVHDISPKEFLPYIKRVGDSSKEINYKF